MYKNKNGITLIALVITIIVMLILVGVTISIGVNGGLFEKAGEAVGKTGNAIEEEQGLTNTDIIDYYVNKKPAVTALKAYSEDLLNDEGVLDENTKYESGYYTAVIPAGFKVSEVEKEQTIAGGLVIKDANGNEFVWIPVKDGEFERTSWADNMIGEEYIKQMNLDAMSEDGLVTKLATIFATEYIFDDCATLEEALMMYGIIENETDSYTIEKLKTYINETGYSSEEVETGEDIKEEIIRIYTLSEEYTEDADNDPTGLYASMVTSVNTYGGFYIGRYEAGSIGNRYNLEEREDETVLVQKGAYPYNYVMWGLEMDEYEEEEPTYGHGAVYLSLHMYDDQEVGVQSTLCYGVQWDAALRFIKDKYNVTNSTAWGNYNNNKFTFTGKYSTNSGKTWSPEEVINETKPQDESWLLTTGASEEKNKAKNIYDLAGNVYEWTMEARSSGRRVGRGGNYGDYGSSSSPASDRIDFYTPDNCDNNLGFRPALYIK